MGLHRRWYLHNGHVTFIARSHVEAWRIKVLMCFLYVLGIRYFKTPQNGIGSCLGPLPYVIHVYTSLLHQKTNNKAGKENNWIFLLTLKITGFRGCTTVFSRKPMNPDNPEGFGG